MPIYAQSSTLRTLLIPLVDVDQTTLANDQVLKYNATTGKFENGEFISTGTGVFVLENNTNAAVNHTMYLLYGETTDDTETELFLNDTSGRITLNIDTTMQFEADIVARNITGSSHCGFKLQGVVDRTDNTTVLVNTVNETIVAETNEAWVAVAEADDVNDTVSIKVTGENGVHIRWVAFVKTTSIQH